jgi:uncharacterized membrane protein YeaQ/YmgE (transglycosylase-associated protein family)
LEWFQIEEVQRDGSDDFSRVHMVFHHWRNRWLDRQHPSQGLGIGFHRDIVFGVFGAVLGGFFARYFHIGVYGFWQTFGMSVVGAAVLLIVLRAFPYMRKAIS